MKLHAINIYEVIMLLSSVQLQKKMWLNPESKLQSSYSEARCQLYDDNCFDVFINSWSIQLNFSANCIFKLHELSNLLELFKEIGYKIDDEEKIITDVRWLIIVDKAEEIIFEWPEEYKSDFLKYLD